MHEVPEYGTTTPAAGWYTDPANASLERWWGGVEWTETTRPRQVVAAAPATAVPGGGSNPFAAEVPGGGLNPFAAEVPGGGLNPFAGEVKTDSSRLATYDPASAFSIAPTRGFAPASSGPQVSQGWYDASRGPAENKEASRALAFGIVSWFFNPLLIFSILGLKFAKRGTENARLLEYEGREPVGRKAASAGRVLSAITLVFGILNVAILAFTIWAVALYHDFTFERVWATQAAGGELAGSTLDCPAEGSLLPGSVIPCTVTLADGRSLNVTFTINNYWAGDIGVEVTE